VKINRHLKSLRNLQRKEASV